MLSRIWVNRASENSLQAFHKRFSRPIRALPSELAGADAWRATTYGHGVLQTNPLGSALDQETYSRCGMLICSEEVAGSHPPHNRRTWSGGLGRRANRRPVVLRRRGHLGAEEFRRGGEPTLPGRSCAIIRPGGPNPAPP